MPKIPCFLCSHELRQRKDKNEKPYFICDPCGMQIFVRGRQGIENLGKLLATLRAHEFPFREHARVLYEIQAVLTEILCPERCGGWILVSGAKKRWRATRSAIPGAIYHAKQNAPTQPSPGR